MVFSLGYAVHQKTHLQKLINDKYRVWKKEYCCCLYIPFIILFLRMIVAFRQLPTAVFSLTTILHSTFSFPIMRMSYNFLFLTVYNVNWHPWGAAHRDRCPPKLSSKLNLASIVRHLAMGELFSLLSNNSQIWTQ